MDDKKYNTMGYTYVHTITPHVIYLYRNPDASVDRETVRGRR